MSPSSVITPHGIVTVRTTTAADAQRVRALRIEALTGSPTSFGSDVADVDARDWTALTNGSTTDTIVVAEHADELIGMTGIHGATRKKESHHADIWGVYVRPAWRKQGVAQTLVNVAVECARAKGIAIVKLTVVPQSGAMSCYLRCGFRVTGVDPAALQWDGKFYDELLMHRWLKPEPLAGV